MSINKSTLMQLGRYASMENMESNKRSNKTITSGALVLTDNIVTKWHPQVRQILGT